VGEHLSTQARHAARGNLNAGGAVGNAPSQSRLVEAARETTPTLALPRRTGGGEECAISLHGGGGYLDKMVPMLASLAYSIRYW
jgi:hypothetical protein